MEASLPDRIYPHDFADRVALIGKHVRGIEMADVIEPRGEVQFPGRFRRLVHVYAAGRPSYPRLLAPRVAGLLGLAGASDILDLGTGPGFLAIAFHGFARRVVAVDPEPAMLRVADDAAREAGVDIRFVEGSSSTIDPELGRFALVTIGRAFHWMDRPRTLERLDTLIEPGGAIALFSESYPAVPENDWYTSFRAVLDTYAANDPARDVLANNKDHETVLYRSPFDHLERVSVLEPRLTPLQRLVDRAFSFARSWDGTPGAHADALERDIRATLAPHVENGLVREVVEGTALIARRSAEVDP